MPPKLLETTPRPAPKGGLKVALAKLALRIGGWDADNDPPDLPKYVLICAPHTSWWDGFWLIVFAWRLDMDMRWLVKAEAAPPGLRWFIRGLGGVPVDRRAPKGLVGDLVRQFAERRELVVAIPPEGTRKKREFWKSGFYFVAREANVPICPSYLDYSRKRTGFGPCFVPTGDIKEDMDFLRAFYGDKKGKFPELFTEPRLREETASTDASPSEARATEVRASENNANGLRAEAAGSPHAIH